MAKTKVELQNYQGESLSPITIASNVLYEDGRNAQEVFEEYSNETFTPTIENSSSMFKVGQGDSVDYSSNVVNGAYESMVLKGKTMVNCIQEPSSEDVVLPYEFEEGRYVTINDTKESGALGVELKGQTLVNEALIEYMNCANYASINGEKLTLDLSRQYSLIEISKRNPLVVPNQTYTCILYDVVGDTTNVNFSIQNGSSTKLHLKDVGYKFKFTMGIGNDLTDRLCYVENLVATSGTVSFKMVLLKGDYTDQDIPYFTGMTSCKMPILTTVGKNLLYKHNDTSNTYGISQFHDGGFTTREMGSYGTFGCIKSLNNPSQAQLDKNPTSVQKGKTYTISCEVKKISGTSAKLNYLKLVGYNNEGDNYSWTNIGWNSGELNYDYNNTVKLTKTVVCDCSYKYIVVAGQVSSDSSGAVYKITNIQLEESSSATAYEDYKTSILSLPEEVVLKDINGIKDTLNCNTGEYVQRIEEKVFDGSENWVQNGQHADGSYRHICNTYTDAKVSSHNVLCDKMSFVKVNGTTGEGMTSDIHITYTTTTGKVQIATTKTLAELKTWLSQNPTTIQYELETPIVTKINLPSTLKSWNTTTHIYSEIPENTLYPILSHSNPTYPVILKPSTKYSIVTNSYSNSHTNSPINFNLGGATASTTVGSRVTAITTPSTLSNELLTMSGRGNKLNNVMVIEGDVVGDEPYFEGICDCKSPILSNVGKNLFDVNGEWHKSTYSHAVPMFANGSQTITTLENGVQITTNNNQYHGGFGQFINIGGINKLRIAFTGEYTDTKTHPEIVVQLLRKGEELPKTMNGTLANTDYNPRKTSFKLSRSGETASKVISTQGYECAYVHLSGGYLASMSGTYTFVAKNICIEDADQVDIYEPYKSNILSFDQKDDKTIVLRSLPNGVCDTLNVETGEYVQRIGELVADGSNIGYKVNGIGVGEMDTFRFQLSDPSIKNVPEVKGNLICDQLPWRVIWSASVERTIGCYAANSENRIIVRMLKEKFDTLNVDGINRYLTNNPITFQYELATPIVTTIDVQGFPYAYTNGHVQLSSGSIEQSLTPTVEYSVATNRNGQIRTNQKMVEKHQQHLDQLQAMIISNMVNTQYQQTLTTLNYDLLKKEVGE